MATQTENAIINVVINGEKAISTFKELNKARADQLALVSKLDRSSPQYQQQAQRLQLLTAAQQAWRKELSNSSHEQEHLNQVVEKNPLPGLMGSLMESITGNSSVSKIFGSLSSALALVTSSGAKAMEVITSMTGMFKLNAEAVKEVTAARVLLQEQMAANLVEQEALTASLAVATSAEEKKIIATKLDKVALEEDTIATQLHMAVQQEQITVTAASTVGFRALKIALASTGIGLLIIGLASLVTYFESTNEGSKKLKVILAQLGAMFQQVLKLVAPLGKAIFDTFSNTAALTLFSSALNVLLIPLGTLVKVFNDLKGGHFGQAWTDIKTGVADFSKNAVTGVKAGVGVIQDLTTNLGRATDTISKQSKTSFADVSKQAADITRARQALTKEERVWSEEKLKQQGQVELLTKKLRDGYLTEKQRLDLGNQAIALREKIHAKDIDIAKRNEVLVQKEQDLNSKKDYQAITDAKNRVTQLTNEKNLEVQNIINRQSKLDNALKSGAETHTSYVKKLAEQAGKLQKDMQNLGAEGLMIALSANDKEVMATAKKYDDQIKLNEDYKKKIKADKNLNQGEKHKLSGQADDNIDQLKQEKAAAMQQVALKQEKVFTDKIKELNAGLTNALKNEYDKQRADVNAKYDQMIIDAGQNADQVATLEKERTKSLDLVDLKEKDDLEKAKLEIVDKYNEIAGDKHERQLAAIKNKYDKERELLRQKFAGQLIDTEAFKKALALLDKGEKKETDDENDDHHWKGIHQAAEYAQAASDAVFAIGAKNRENETNAKLAALNKQRAAELSNKNLTEAEKASINAKYDKKEKAEKLKAWKADQKAALLQAVINGALAVVKALPNVPLSILAGVAAASQIAVIAKQKPPEFATGGILPNGLSHAAGGMNVVDPLGNVLANIEGGEPILSRATAAANPNLVNALLASGGKTVNYERILQARTLTNNGANLPVAAPVVPIVQAQADRQQGQSTDTVEIWDYLKRLTEQVAQTDAKPVQLSTRLMADQQAKQVQISDAVNG